MSDQDFQIILNNTDYSKLQSHQKQNKKLIAQNKKLNQQINVLKIKIKDQTRAVYVRDAFIDYVVSQSDYAFGTILSLDIISSDITQSFYQDVVSHEQNGISSIQLRQALQLYISKNQRIFERFSQIQQKFAQLQKRITQLETNKKENLLSQIKQEPKKKIFSNSELKSKQFQLNNCNATLLHIKAQILRLEAQKQKLIKQNEYIRNKNLKLLRENQFLSKKLEIQGDKSYAIKLLVDQYYNQLQKNLLKVGGLSNIQIGTVISNQMKGILQYINILTKKAFK